MIPGILLHPVTWVMLMLAGHALHSAWRWTRGHGPADIAGRHDAGEWARTAYLAGIPIAAIALRVVPSPAHIGLGLPARPWIGLGWAVAAGIAAAAAISLWEAGWRPRVALERLRTARTGPRRLVWTGGRAISIARRTLEHELHWAFFRAAALATSFGFYEAGAIGPSLWLALALLGLEGWSDPAVRARLAAADTAGPVARTAALAIASTLAFALSGSSIGGGVAQLLGRFAIAHIGPSTLEPFSPARVDAAVVEPVVVG
jgi:hypothetical protein